MHPSQTATFAHDHRSQLEADARRLRLVRDVRRAASVAPRSTDLAAPARRPRPLRWLGHALRLPA